MANERTTEQKIADAQRVEQFLRDDVIRRAIESLEQKYIEQMIGAENSEQRAKAQGKIHAIRGFAGELTAVVGEGAHEEAMQQLREKFHDQKQKGLLA